MFQRIATAWLLRRVLRDLTRLADAIERQGLAITRLADHLAPPLTAQSPADRSVVRADTGVTHLDPIDAGLALDFVARMTAATGHTPDDDEILIYLADEKTHDLAARLASRDEQLARLQEERR